jgi:hypothetical protein
MAAQQAQRLAEAAGEPEVQGKACQHGKPARRGVAGLDPVPMPRRAVVRFAGAPDLGRHAGPGDGLQHRLVAHRPGPAQHHHAAVQHVEGEVILAAHQRPDRPLEDRDFLRAVETLHLEGESWLTT